MLNRHLMMCVISYLPYSQGASSVCKYWRELFKSQPSDRVTQAEKWYVGKMNKQERNRLLFEIQLSKKSNLSFSESRNNDKGGNTTTLVSSSHQHQYSSDTSGSGGRLGSEQRLVAPVVETAVKITYDHILPQTMSSSHKSASLTNSKPADVGRQHHRSTEKKTKGSASSRRRKSSRHDPGDTANLQYLQQIRSEQQIKSIVDYISDTMQKIDGLQNDRRRVKKLIKAWNTSHERKYGHAPSAQERKGHLRSLHEEYRQVGDML